VEEPEKLSIPAKLIQPKDFKDWKNIQHKHKMEKYLMH
jgi:hypothetical protein